MALESPNQDATINKGLLLLEIEEAATLDHLDAEINGPWNAYRRTTNFPSKGLWIIPKTQLFTICED